MDAAEGVSDVGQTAVVGQASQPHLNVVIDVGAFVS